jgi:hypothetical protein
MLAAPQLIHRHSITPGLRADQVNNTLMNLFQDIAKRYFRPESTSGRDRSLFRTPLWIPPAEHRCFLNNDIVPPDPVSGWPPIAGAEGRRRRNPRSWPLQLDAVIA